MSQYRLHSMSFVISPQGKLDIKTFTNCRFGMMGWAVLVITYALAQYEDIGYVADSLSVQKRATLQTPPLPSRALPTPSPPQPARPVQSLRLRAYCAVPPAHSAPRSSARPPLSTCACADLFSATLLICRFPPCCSCCTSPSSSGGRPATSTASTSCTTAPGG